MPISSPADLNPRAWLDPNAGTYNGSNQLTALANGGTDGGSFTISGTPAKGTAIGGLQVLRIDSIAKQLTLSLATISSGELTVVFVGKLVSAGVNGILGLDWPGGGSAKAFYADTGAGESLAFGNACCSVDASHAPSLYSVAGGLSDTNFHVLHWQLGTTNGLWRDNVAQAITGGSNASAPGAMPATGAQTWDFGCADPSSETANADIAAILIFDYALTTQQRTDLYDWYQSQASGAISGSASIAMPKPAISAAGTVAIQGTLAKAMPAPALSAAGTVVVQGSLSKALPAPSLSAGSTVAVRGASAIALPAPALAAAGVVGAAPVIGEAAITMPGLSMVAAGTVATPQPGPNLQPGGIPSGRPLRFIYEPQPPAETVATTCRQPVKPQRPSQRLKAAAPVPPIDTHDEEEEALVLLLVA